jgi:hypothetical protein
MLRPELNPLIDMKRRLLVAMLSILAFTESAYAQKQARTIEPLKESNVVYVSYANSDEDAYKIIGRKLLSEGYQIKKADKDFFNIQTNMTQRDNYDFDFAMDITAMNGVAIIRGATVSSGFEFKPYYGKGKGIMVPVVAFSFMHKFGNQLKRELTEGQMLFGVEKN